MSWGMMISLVLVSLLVGPTVVVRVGFQSDPLAAKNVDGNDLLSRCLPLVKILDGDIDRSAKEMTNAHRCLDYLSGFLDGFRVARDVPSVNICTPKEGVQGGQTARIVVRYLQQNPAKIHESARVSISVAMAKAFPCGR